MNRIKTFVVAFVLFFVANVVFCQDADFRITRQSTEYQACAGAEFQLFVTVEGGTQPYSYQWFKSAVAMSGATESTFTFASLSSDDTGDYYCRIIDAATSPDTLLSAPMRLHVNGGLPIVTTENTVQQACLGSDPKIIFTIGNGQCSKIWYHNGVSLGEGGPSRKIEDVSLDDEGDYYIVATNACGTAEPSPIVHLDVVTPITIISDVANQTVCEGEAVTFAVEATGDDIVYTWLADDVAISGAPNAASYSYDNVTYDMHGHQYSVVLQNFCTNDTSRAGVLIVNNLPDITAHPLDAQQCLGASFTVSAAATSTTNLTYQWYYAGDPTARPIASATANTLTLNDLPNESEGVFCRITNSCGSVNTDTANLVTLLPPRFTQQPNGATVCTGDNVTMAAKVTGASPLTYQWRHNEVDIVPADNISGINSNSLTITGVTIGHRGQYFCCASNGCGTAYSDTVEVVVNEPVVFTSQPDDSYSQCEGTPLSLGVGYQGTTPVQLNWYKVVGADSTVVSTLDSLHFAPGLLPDDEGSYCCVATNVCGDVPTHAFALDVKLKPTITVQPDDVEACEGGAGQFNVSADGEPPLSYMWYRNDEPLTSQTAASCNISSAHINNVGTYFCKVRNGCGEVNSSTADLELVTAPTISRQPSLGRTLCASDPLTLSVGVEGDVFYAQWYRNDVPISGQTDTLLHLDHIATSQAGDYKCKIYNACEDNLFSNVVTVNVNAVPTVNLGPDKDFCQGDAADTLAPLDGTYLQYKWYANGVEAASTAMLVVDQSGNYVLKVTDEAGCSNNDTISVTYHPVHEIAFDDEPINACGSYLLDAGEGAYSYAWNSTDANVHAITVTTTGDYSVTVTGDNFGCSSTKSVHINIGEAVHFSLGDDRTMTTDETIEIGIDDIFASYLWNTGHQGSKLTIVGADYREDLGEHDFWLKATNAAGCNYTDTIKITVISGSAVDDIACDNVSIFPNPAYDNVVIGMSAQGQYSLQIIDMQGKVIVDDRFCSDVYNLDVSKFKTGVYIVKIAGREQVVVRKLQVM